MNWLSVLVAIGLALACYKAWDFVVQVRPRFWLECWRQPDLAFVMIVRDPCFKVLDSDPDEAGSLAGWIGPTTMWAYGQRFAVYVDVEQHPDALDRLADRLADHRRRARIRC